MVLNYSSQWPVNWLSQQQCLAPTFLFLRARGIIKFPPIVVNQSVGFGETTQQGCFLPEFWASWEIETIGLQTEAQAPKGLDLGTAYRGKNGSTTEYFPNRLLTLARAEWKRETILLHLASFSSWVPHGRKKNVWYNAQPPFHLSRKEEPEKKP